MVPTTSRVGYGLFSQEPSWAGRGAGGGGAVTGGRPPTARTPEQGSDTSSHSQGLVLA